MTVTPNSIITPQKPVQFTAVATTADVAWHVPVNVVTLIDDATQNVNGLRLTKLYAIQRAALAADLNCVIYKKVGTTYTLLDSAVMPNTTPSATVANKKTVFGVSEEDPLTLGIGEGLAVAIGTTIANGIAFVARGGAY